VTAVDFDEHIVEEDCTRRVPARKATREEKGVS
jgi:hypothetical protein